MDKSHKRSPPYSGNVKECALVKPPRLGPSAKESTKGKRQVEDTKNIKRHRRHTNIKAEDCVVDRKRHIPRILNGQICSVALTSLTSRHRGCMTVCLSENRFSFSASGTTQPG